MGILIVLIIFIGFIALMTSLADAIGKLIIWIGLPLIAMISIGLLVSSFAGQKAGAFSAVATFIWIITQKSKIFS